MHVLPCKYVFKVKDGAPKVRLFAMGCRQIHGVDYNETFAPVVSLTTIRTIFALASYHDLELEQMDVVTAFLNGDLDEDIYMAIPDGFKNKYNSSKVCKLQKSLYGLKQSPRQWYAKMHSYLVNELGFISSKNDPCLYVNHQSTSLLLIGLYVDDLLIAGSNKAKISLIKKELTSRFEMKDLGQAKVMLGIEICRDRMNRQLFISQSEYTFSILARFGMENSRSVATPMDRPSNASGESVPAIDVPYRQAIGSLMYLLIGSRPDLAFAVGKLSRYSEKPSQENWIVVKRIFRYISGTKNYGILYDGNRTLITEGFSNADWAGCRVTRKSTSGIVFLVAGGAVCWKSKKQTCVATSTCEAEYIACCLAAKEAVWLSRLLSDLNNSPSQDPVTINVGNDGTIDTAYNASINQKNKHIDIAYHYTRDCILSGKIKVLPIDSSEQAADLLTKPLERVLHERLRLKQGEDISILTNSSPWSVFSQPHYLASIVIQLSSQCLPICHQTQNSREYKLLRWRGQSSAMISPTSIWFHSKFIAGPTKVLSYNRRNISHITCFAVRTHCIMGDILCVRKSTPVGSKFQKA